MHTLHVFRGVYTLVWCLRIIVSCVLIAHSIPLVFETFFSVFILLLHILHIHLTWSLVDLLGRKQGIIFSCVLFNKKNWTVFWAQAIQERIHISLFLLYLWVGLFWRRLSLEWRMVCFVHEALMFALPVVHHYFDKWGTLLPGEHWIRLEGHGIHEILIRDTSQIEQNEPCNVGCIGLWNSLSNRIESASTTRGCLLHQEQKGEEEEEEEESFVFRNPQTTLLSMPRFVIPLEAKSILFLEFPDFSSNPNVPLCKKVLQWNNHFLLFARRRHWEQPSIHWWVRLHPREYKYLGLVSEPRFVLHCPSCCVRALDAASEHALLPDLWNTHIVEYLSLV